MFEESSRQSLEWEEGGRREHSIRGKADFALKIDLHSSQEADSWMSKLRIHDAPWWPGVGGLLWTSGLRTALSYCIGGSPEPLRGRG